MTSWAEADYSDLDSVASALEHLAPDAAPFRPLTTIGSGWFSVAVETASGNVFRLACAEEVAERHAKEASLLPWLVEHLPLAVPAIRWHLVPNADPALPYGAVGYPKLVGEQPKLAKFTVVQRRRFIHDLAHFLAKLHRISVSDARAHGAQWPEATDL